MDGMPQKLRHPNGVDATADFRADFRADLFSSHKVILKLGHLPLWRAAAATSATSASATTTTTARVHRVAFYGVVERDHSGEGLVAE